MAEIGDLVELLIDIPERGHRAGVRGTIVHGHGQSACEIEVADDRGETKDILAVRPEQFLVVWRSETQQWVPVEEQLSALLTHIPESVAHEVLDFARFLSTRYHDRQQTSAVSTEESSSSTG